MSLIWENVCLRIAAEIEGDTKAIYQNDQTNILVTIAESKEGRVRLAVQSEDGTPIRGLFFVDAADFCNTYSLISSQGRPP